MKKLWFYPLGFGLIGALLGLVLRFAFTGEVSNFNFKYVTHAHSHAMLLGFIFNALILLVWENFVQAISKTDQVLFFLMQGCIGLFTVAFIFQGYAFFSILFSSLHLWLSYILTIRIWRKLKYSNTNSLLIKWGIIFHFISSLGPYALGPLMIFNMQDSPWYGQAIFFYLHFQYFGVYFLWMLALIFKNSKVLLRKKEVLLLVVSLAVLFAHSLEYDFDSPLLGILGLISSLGLVWVLAQQFSIVKKSSSYKFIYGGILFIALISLTGSIPAVADWFAENRFNLIAWLHFLFLGIYTPFIWLQHHLLKNKYIFILYFFVFGLSELALIFPYYANEILPATLMQLLFGLYVFIFIIIAGIHLKGIFEPSEENITE